jgi:hypothetical protein
VNRLEIGAATALVGAGVYQIHDAYLKHAGPLNDVRNSVQGSAETLQRLVDADTLTGGLTLLAGGALSIATGSWYPVALGLLAFGLVAWYYHAALAAPAVRDASTGREDDGE